MKKVGQILSEKRKAKGLSLDEVEASTKIRKKTLKFLEESDWDALPTPTFTKGLLKNYGRFLGIPVEDLLAFYRREFDEKKIRSLPKEAFAKKRFRFTPTGVTIGFFVIAIFAAIFYLFVQYQNFTGTPLLEVEEPKDNTRLESGQVNVVGRTWPDALLKINGQEVRLSPGGSFSEAVGLPEGINTITITSANRFGKISTVKRTVIVTGSQEASQTPNPKVGIEVKIGPNAANILVEVDGKTKFEGVLASGTDKKFQAQERIRLLTQNAGSTKIIFNGTETILGKEGESIERSFP